MDTLLRIGLSNALLAAVLALVAAGVARFCRRPAVVHGLWLLVLLKLLTPSLLPVLPSGPFAPVPSEARADAEDPEPARDVLSHPAEAPLQVPEATPDLPAERTAPRPRADAPRDWVGLRLVSRLPAWRPAAIALWLAGSLLWWSVAGLRWYRFHRLVRAARPAPATLHNRVAGLAARLGLARAPGVWFTAARVPPLVYCFGGRSRLLLPRALWGRLNEEQRAAVLVHELAHLRRRDHWVRWLELVAGGLYWWHPVVWWARREIAEAEEQCCDAWVLWALPAAADAYATALLAALAFVSEARPALPVGASGMGRLHRLKRRLSMILHEKTPGVLSRGGSWPVLALGTALLLFVPTWAQSQPPAAEAPPQPRAESKPAPEADQALEKARAEVQRLNALVGGKRVELGEAESRLAAAKATLAALEKPSANVLFWRVQPVEVREVPLQVQTFGRSDVRWRVISIDNEKKTPPTPEQRLHDLETKLESLQKEIAALKQELKSKKPQEGRPQK